MEMAGQSSKLPKSQVHSHLGTAFTIWRRRQTWFWLVPEQHSTIRGAIGTAATETKARADACASIEEISAQLPSRLASLVGSGGKSSSSAQDQYVDLCGLGWMDYWMNVAHELTDGVVSAWAELVERSS
jgi:hypothetical protein